MRHIIIAALYLALASPVLAADWCYDGNQTLDVRACRGEVGEQKVTVYHDDNYVIATGYETTLLVPAGGLTTEATLTWNGGKFEFTGNATMAAREFLRELNRQGEDFCKSRE